MSSVLAALLPTVVVLASSGGSGREVRRLKQRVKELEEELERREQVYRREIEELRNVNGIMVTLFKAVKSGAVKLYRAGCISFELQPDRIWCVKRTADGREVKRQVYPPPEHPGEDVVVVVQGGKEGEEGSGEDGGEGGEE